MQVSVWFGMYWFRTSSSSDRTALALEFLSRSDRQHRLRRSIAMAVQDDRCQLVGSMLVTFYSPRPEVVHEVFHSRNFRGRRS